MDGVCVLNEEKGEGYFAVTVGRYRLVGSHCRTASSSASTAAPEALYSASTTIEQIDDVLESILEHR